MLFIKDERLSLKELVSNMLNGFWSRLAFLMVCMNIVGMSICSANTIQWVLSRCEKKTHSETDSLNYSSVSTVRVGRLKALESLILSNSPKLDKVFAAELAESIYKHGLHYGVSPNVIASIAFIESSYRLNAVNAGSNDYGIMQVNAWNVRAYNLNKEKLLTDLNYSVESGVMILSWFVKTYPLDEAIMRYNCGTRPSCIKLESVKRYLRRAKRYW